MTVCQACEGKAQTYLCGKCQRDLRASLADYDWLLSRLYETAVGQIDQAVQFRGDGGGRRSVRTMHGDDSIGSHIERLPGCRCDARLRDAVAHDFIGPLRPEWRRLATDESPECDCDPMIARRRREHAALAHALALGRVNASASELHDDARNTLRSWVRHLCESRGVEVPNLATTVRMARWLHKHVAAIANDEAAGEIVDELAYLRKRIERTVNRPQTRKTLGKCPTWLEGEQRACGRKLSAPEDAVEVRCRDCGETHQCAHLQLLLVGDMEREKVTMARVRRLNRNLPPEYRTAESTMRMWIADGRLKPRGRSDDGEPLYLWRDVRKLHDETGKKNRPSKTATR